MRILAYDIIPVIDTLKSATLSLTYIYTPAKDLHIPPFHYNQALPVLSGSMVFIELDRTLQS